MGSLDNGQPIAQDGLVSRHSGYCIEVTNVVSNARVACHPLAEGGRGLNASNPTPDPTPPPVVLPPPRQIDDLVLWLDAMDTDSLDLSGMPAEVNSWSDKSEAGIISQFDAAINPPTYLTSAINGNPALSFDGAAAPGNALVAETPLFTATPVTIFAVAALQGFLNRGTILWTGDKNSNAQNAFSLEAYNTGGFINLQYYRIETDGPGTGTNRAQSERVNPWNDPYIITAQTDNPSSRRIKLIGPNVLGTWIEDTNTQTPTPGNINRTSIGRTEDLNPDNLLRGLIGEIIVYNRTLTDDEISDIESYLSDRWGI